MTSDIIRQARRADLAEWLRVNNEPLKRTGQWWSLKNHDSIRIQGNKWYHYSQGVGGNAVDFLVYYYQMTPKQAILSLARSSSHLEDIGIGEKRGVEKKNKTHPAFDFSSLSTDSECRRVLAYLVKSRRISASIVMREIKNSRIYQEKVTGNAVFVMLDETGAVAGAEINGTLSYKNSRFKGVKAGSLAGYGFNTGQRYNPRYILYFESAIDLLSFMTISNKLSRLLSECLLISMAGLKPNVVETSLWVFGRFSAIPVFCVDNDPAGEAFLAKRLEEFPNALIRRPNGAYKDWNDQLCNVVSNKSLAEFLC